VIEGGEEVVGVEYRVEEVEKSTVRGESDLGAECSGGGGRRGACGGEMSEVGMGGGGGVIWEVLCYNGMCRSGLMGR